MLQPTPLGRRMSPRDNLKSNKSGKVKKSCAGCSKIFFIWPNEAKRGRKYCSRSCTYKRDYRECVLCGILFTVAKKNPRQVCGKKCPALRVEYSCIVCSITVSRPRCFGLGKFCSDRCHKMWLIDENISADPVRGVHRPYYGNKRKYKIRKGDLIDRQDVFDFFDWMCIVCDEPIDKTIEYPDKMSATLEHIIPLSKGGTHTWDNVAPSHLLCNEKKGSDTIEEVVERHKSIFEVRNIA